MAVPVILTQSLPDARVGFDYSLTAQQLRADITVTWSMTGAPAWLQLNTTTGALSGRPANGDCGVSSPITFIATVGMDTDTLVIPITVSLCPNGIDLIPRILQKLAVSTDNCRIDELNLIAAGALKVITDYTEIPINSPCEFATFTDESVATRSYSDRVTTKYWPIQVLTSATWGGQNIVTGSLKDFYLGKCQMAINQNQEYLIYRTAGVDGYPGIFITYKAGYVALPADLYEVFIYIGLKMFREKDRVGIGHLAVGESTTEYTQEYPAFVKATLSRYRRLSYG